MAPKNASIKKNDVTEQWKLPAGYTSNILRRAEAASATNYASFISGFTPRQKKQGNPEKTLWRWEFLRRMPEYRKDYARFVKHEIPPDPGILFRRYGLLGCAPDPDLLCPPQLVFCDLERDLRQPFACYLIDIRYPVRKTTREIEQFIRHMRKNGKIRERAWPSVAMYSKLLRVLDALKEKASVKEIGKSIFGSRDLKRTRQKIAQAKEVQKIITAYQRLKSDK